ncbi:BTAD domain-containing putative transcriptional regulator [Streptomyces polygonati]|uniref:BTAD domain-containing putative transcriptional regulator n=1 Tax=Streptomyces polygonati TaxID=1617087 RepID=A0ABV8HJJ3_9ACTN
MNGVAAPPTGRRTRFTVLGLLAVTDGRDSVALQPSRPAALLAALLLHANSVVSAEFLQRVIWGEETPAQAKSALHSCVLRLRRLFGKYGVAGNAIEAVPGGYRLTADAETLDLVEFRELLGLAYSGAEPGPESELRLLRAALALWQPPLLANVHSDLLHRDEIPRLNEEWLRASERVFDLELADGRHREALTEIWSAARTHPLHERFTEQLMEALHRTGRRAEALAEYRKAKTHLAQQLGVDPGPALQRLELAILRGEADLSRGTAAPKPGNGSGAASGPRAGRTAPAAAESAAPPAGGEPGGAGPDLPYPAGAGPDAGRREAEAEGGGDSDAAPVPGDRVLERLVGAGLLHEGPRGHYRMHELLRAFARAAAADGVGARAGAGPVPAPGPDPAPTPIPSPRPRAAELHPTEA